MVCRITILLFFSISSLHAQLDIRFMRFYKNDKDFISDLRLLSTARFNRSHLQVFYNSKKIPLIKEWVNPSGEVNKREFLEYDSNRKLIRRYYSGANQQIDSVKYFGENEPWSIEFRKVLPSNNYSYFQNQQTMFTLNSSNQFQSIKFNTVQNIRYGQIDFIYDHLGFLVGEIWKSFPENKIIRKYSYSIDILTGKKEIREFNQNSEQISYVVLSQPPAESLYKTSPPRLGNNLDEISILLEDIENKNLRIPFDVFIPKTDHDLMFLSNGDSLMIEGVQFRQQHILFRIAGEKPELTMPINRVKSVVSKYGEQIYP
jgi:hypothetical protein